MGTRGSCNSAVVGIAGRGGDVSSDGAGELGPGPVAAAVGLWVACPCGGNPAGRMIGSAGASAASNGGGNGARAAIKAW
jgi:hypothetical protein